MDEPLFSRLCYVFPSSGMSDLKVGVCSHASIFFFQSAPAHPFPRNAFYGVEADVARYTANMEVHDRVMAVQPVACPVALSTVETFLSLANRNRALLERCCSFGSEALDQVHSLYSNAILLSLDQSASKLLDIIGKRVKSVTFCSTDDEVANLVPADLRKLVAEGLAGLSMVACHMGNMCQSVSYATAALHKHPSALPYINCVRLVALSKRDMASVLMITEMVILPFYLRSKLPAIHGLYNVELGIWDPSLRATLTRLPEQLLKISETMADRFAGQYGVMRAKYVENMFVEKICAVCGKGANGEKLQRCGRCSKIYYCGRVCQMGDWHRHRQGGCVV